MAEDQPQRVSLEDYSSSSTPQYLTSIARLEVQAANITYPHSFIQLIQDNLFHGLPNEDPYAHLATYIEIYNTVKIEEFQKMSSTSIYFLFLWQVKQKNGCTHSKGIACGHGMSSHLKKSLRELTSQDALLAQNKLLAKPIKTLTKTLNKLPQQLHAVQLAPSSVMQIGGCNIYGGAYESGMCMTQDYASKEVNYMVNPICQGFHQGRPPGYHQGGNFSQGQDFRSHSKNNFNKDQGNSSIRPPNQGPNVYEKTTRLQDTMSQFMQVSLSNHKSTELAINNLKMSVEDQKVTFNLFEVIKHPSDNKTCFKVEPIEQEVDLVGQHLNARPPNVAKPPSRPVPTDAESPPSLSLQQLVMTPKTFLAQQLLDASTGGKIKLKTLDEVTELIENMAASGHAILCDRAYTPIKKSLLQLTSQDTPLAKNKLLAKQLETLSKLPQQLHAVQHTHSSVMQFGGCNICGGAYEPGIYMTQDDSSKVVNYITNPHRQGFH
ncbi:hypothetical protein GmHk_09G026160 [Glycine max]|nr:hypothetical protein GmHk_09G026160 [Glycine max]